MDRLTKRLRAAFIAVLMVATPAVVAAAAPASAAPVPRADGSPESCRAGSVIDVVAHQDDDILFMNPDLATLVRTPHTCVTSLYLTTGDAGLGTSYWMGRELGVEAAFDVMDNLPLTAAWTSRTFEARSGSGQVHELAAVSPVADPRITLLFMRLPNAGPSGAGHGSAAMCAAAGIALSVADCGQSLDRLWRGTEGTITSQRPLTGSFRPSGYTRQDLIDTIGQVLLRFEVTRLNTQDILNVSRGGVNDHVEHLVGAQITFAAQEQYPGALRVVSYEDYPVTNQAIDVTGADLALKHAVWAAYYPHDLNSCACGSPTGVITDPVWLPYQYTVSDGEGGADVARRATATASSQSPGQEASRAVDGIAAGYPYSPGENGVTYNEWATKGGGAGSWITLTWSKPVRIDQVWLNDRPNPHDQVLAGVLIFDDGSRVRVGSLPNSGTPLVIPITSKLVRSLTFTVTAVSATTHNIGLSELAAYGPASEKTELHP